MRLIIAAVLLTVASPVLAQPAPVTAVAGPDAARLAAATRLVDVVMPPALRDMMIAQTTDAMAANIGKAIMNSPQMVAAFEREPRARPIYERYLAKQGEETRRLMREMMPEMLGVMARYYANSMTVTQLNEAHDFYATPSGQAFALAAAQVLANPEYAALFQSMTTKAMQRAPLVMQGMAEELKALGPPVTSK